VTQGEGGGPGNRPRPTTAQWMRRAAAELEAWADDDHALVVHTLTSGATDMVGTTVEWPGVILIATGFQRAGDGETTQCWIVPRSVLVESLACLDQATHGWLTGREVDGDGT
jgi:hypothetical protein